MIELTKQQIDDMRTSLWKMGPFTKEAIDSLCELAVRGLALPTEALPPVAYVIQATSDGSIRDEIAPVGYTMFDRRLAALKDDPWVKNGGAKVVPLYLAPPSPQLPPAIAGPGYMAPPEPQRGQGDK